jgi:hypothetical protein
MIKNIKTFEEYRYFKIRSKKPGIVVTPPPVDDLKPYWGWADARVDNTRDPNEPFFNNKKWKYLTNKNREKRRELNNKNAEIFLKRVSDIFKIDIDFIKDFQKKYGSLGNPHYSKDQNFWELSIGNEQSLFYFVDENDFIGEYKDSTIEKPLRKRFTTADDYFTWWIHMKNTYNQRVRAKFRKERGDDKTNEEYRFFKGRKYSSGEPNAKDPNEPFLNRNKPNYKREKRLKVTLSELGISFDYYKELKKEYAESVESYENGLGDIWNVGDYYHWQIGDITASLFTDVDYDIVNYKSPVEDFKTFKWMKKKFSHVPRTRDNMTGGHDLEGILQFAVDLIEKGKEYREKKSEEDRKIYHRQVRMLDEEPTPAYPKHSKRPDVKLNDDDTSTFDSYKYKPRKRR